MIIAYQQLLLKSIAEDDLEELRNWRNSASVNHYLISRNPISSEEQKIWYKGLDKGTSIYFIILYRNEKAGLIYAHNIDPTVRAFEGSIFIGNSKFSNSYIPVQSALLISHFFFNHLHYKTAYSTVHFENSKALELDKKLGFSEVSKQDWPYIKSSCSAESFNIHSKPYVDALLRLNEIEIKYQTFDKGYTFLNHK